jgi:hypothetical protein
MKTKLLYLIALASFATAVPLATTGCQQAPNERVQAVQTLRIIGQTAKTSMDGATQLLKQGSITVEQWRKVADFYDHKLQPTYALAVATAQSDLSTPASPDLIGLAATLAALVAELTAK